MSKNINSRGQLPAANTYTRQAPERATSFNGKSGTFTAVIATPTPVLRRDLDGEYFEILSLNPKSVRLERLQSGVAPLLDSHRAGSARDQIGVVTDVRIENGQLVATARLSARDDVKPIAADLAGGTPPNVSLGYRVYASTESVDANGRTVVTQTDWEPYEMNSSRSRPIQKLTFEVRKDCKWTTTKKSTPTPMITTIRIDRVIRTPARCLIVMRGKFTT